MLASFFLWKTLRRGVKHLKKRRTRFFWFLIFSWLFNWFFWYFCWFFQQSVATRLLGLISIYPSLKDAVKEMKSTWAPETLLNLMRFELKCHYKALEKKAYEIFLIFDFFMTFWFFHDFLINFFDFLFIFFLIFSANCTWFF